MLDLSIIIVNYNVKEFLANLLHSLRTAAKNISHEIIVVDNASEDGSTELIKSKFPEIKLIENQNNVGFGSANNQALKIARGKYFLLINPDTIVKEDTLEKMIEMMEADSTIGAAGCKVLNPDGSLQLACRRSFPGPWTSFTKVVGLSKLFPNSKIFAKYNLTYLDENNSYEVDALSGAFMMIRKSVYDQIGGFDQQFFMYGEDLDLCYRIQRAGFKVFYFHETEIIHYKGESTKRSSIDETKIFYQAMQLFVSKHFTASFLVSWILRFAITLRKAAALLNIYKLPLFAICFDLLIYIFALMEAESIYANERWPGFPAFVIPYVYIVPGVIQLIISLFFGVYQKRNLSILKLVIALFTGMLFLAALTFFFKQFAFSRAVLLINYAILFVLLSSWRIIFKLVFKIGIAADSRKQRTLIVTGETGSEDLIRKLRKSLSNLNEIVGLVSSSKKDLGKKIENIEIIGSIDTINKTITEMKIDTVIFNSKALSYNEIFRTIALSGSGTTQFLVAGSELDFVVGKSTFSILDDISLMKIEYNISAPLHKTTKWIFDKFASLVLLLFYPLLFLLSNFVRRKNDARNFLKGVLSVLSGKKSFVGINKEDSKNKIYLGKVGLTGLWYIEHIQHSDEDEIRKLNLYYAKNQNVWLDIEIFGKTISKMIFKSE
ncbi:MAG: glycosyltransferase [Melioribacteraceae bacterium]|nr:glycosyltransferase [Melioribacteraceae bacterium]